MNPYQQASHNLTPGHYFSTSWQDVPDLDNHLASRQIRTVGIVLHNGTVGLFRVESFIVDVIDDMPVFTGVIHDLTHIRGDGVCCDYPRADNRGEVHTWADEECCAIATGLFNEVKDGAMVRRHGPAFDAITTVKRSTDRQRAR